MSTTTLRKPLETGHTHDPQPGLPRVCSQAGFSSHLQPLPVPPGTPRAAAKTPTKASRAQMKGTLSRGDQTTCCRPGPPVSHLRKPRLAEWPAEVVASKLGPAG